MYQLLRHLALPHESNNHRAKLLHHSSLLLLIAVLFLTSGLVSFIGKHNQGVLGISYSITPEELLILTNARRQEKGLPPLTINQSLVQAASRKVADMFAKNYWAHIAPDGTTPWYFIRSSGYEYVYAGENLARGFTTSEDVINAWMASPTHRENMLSPNYTEIGFAIQEGTLTGDDTVVVVEMMGNRNRTIASTQKSEPPNPFPTPTISQNLVEGSALPKVTPTPTSIITPEPTTIPVDAGIRVAAYRNDPLINKQSFQKNIALIVVVGMLGLLSLDIIVVERRKIVRLLSHNIDHLIFFSMVLFLILLITRGGVL